MSIKLRVLLVVNPISGGRDKTPMTDQITAILQERGHELRIYRTTGEQDKEDLRALVSQYKPERVFLAGGDGTIKLLAEILKTEKVPLGIFPAGSSNGLAENLDLPSDTRALADIALGNNFVDLDTININNELCLHISDIGLNAALIKNYQEGKVRGKLGYLLQSIPTLIKSEFPFQFELNIQGRTIHRQAVLLALANARKYGTGSNINPKGKFDDGLFEVLVFKELSFSEIIKTFREEVELSQDFVEIFSTSEVHIKMSKSVPFQIDGEYRGDVRNIHATTAPVRIRIAVPEKKATQRPRTLS